MGCSLSVNYVDKEQVYLKPKSTGLDLDGGPVEMNDSESVDVDPEKEEVDNAGNAGRNRNKNKAYNNKNEISNKGSTTKNGNTGANNRKYSSSQLRKNDGTVIVKVKNHNNEHRIALTEQVSSKSAPAVAQTSPLANLIGIATAMKNDADTKLKQRMNPNVQQLEAFVSSMVGVLKQNAGSAPVRIKQILVIAFQPLQYDFNKSCINSRASARTFNLKVLCESLKSAVENLSNWAPPPAIKQEDMKNIEKAAAQLWYLDANRMVENEDYELDLQKEKNPNDHRDVASRGLFSYVKQEKLERPTYKAFLSLLDNYYADQGKTETYTAEEIAETYNFLNLIMDTAPMQYCHQWLVANHKAPSDRNQFIELLRSSWFGLYRRKATDDSSGFEHVFLGERDGEKVSGLHNWLQIYLEEKQKKLDYKGKIKSRNRRANQTSDRNRFISIQFEWMQQEKFISSSLIGTSPEFEFALLSMCFFNGKENTKVELGSHSVNIKCFTIKQKRSKFVGSAFPEDG